MEEQFEKMCLDVKNEGLEIYNISAYRSYEKQLNIYNNNLINKGLDATDIISARPGNSEHQSGLALDVNILSESFANTKEYNWLKENSYKYGFIERYPKDYTKITGYNYEPWHLRYIGIEDAMKIKKENITFDEYYAFYIDNKDDK